MSHRGALTKRHAEDAPAALREGAVPIQLRRSSSQVRKVGEQAWPMVRTTALGCLRLDSGARGLPVE